jgi:hypothetical protein
LAHHLHSCLMDVRPADHELFMGGSHPRASSVAHQPLCAACHSPAPGLDRQFVQQWQLCCVC